MKRMILASIVLCIFFLDFRASAPAATVYYGCVTSGGSLVGVSTSPVTCQPNQSLIYWNQTGPAGPPGTSGMSYMGGLVAFVPSFQSCVEGSGLNGCTPKALASVNLVQGQDVTLELVPDPPELQNIIRVEIWKQPGPSGSGIDYSVYLKVWRSATTYQATVSPSRPLFSTLNDPVCISNPSACPLPFLTRLMSDSLLTLEFDPSVVAGGLRLVETNSAGAISSASMKYVAGTNAATLKVDIWNAGDERADFVTSVQCAGINPVAAQSKTLNPQESTNLTFALQASGPIGNGNTCTVILLGVDGGVKDSTTAVPVPVTP